MSGGGTSFIPYQVDYTVQNAAKTLGFSKKRVTFKFGFASERALREGGTGPACRGSEHEITFVWSLKTGKRQLLLDNRDVHFSESGQNGWTADRLWQHSFPLKDKATHRNYKVHFISQPKERDLTDQRPFDLRIGGMSYFQFNKIFQLGTNRMVAGQVQDRHGSGRDSPMNAEERRQLAAAKLASLKDLEEQQFRKAAASKQQALQQAEKQDSMQRVEEALISFEDDPPAPPVPTQVPVHAGALTTSSQGMPAGYHASSMTLDSAFAGPDGGGTGSSSSFANSNSNLYGSSTNPYGAPPPAAAAGGGAYNNPYGSNPYGAPAPSPYGAAPAASSYGSNPYGAPAPSSSDPNSFALTPYQPAGGGQQQQPQAQPYVDATGRVSMMQPQQQSGMSSGGAAAPGSFGSSPYYNSQQQQQQQQPSTGASTSTSNMMHSPSSQTYNSYGSAPSFAQPSSQQQQSSYGNYGSNAPSFAQPPPPQPNFAQPPQYSSGYPPQAPSSAPQQQYPPSYSYGS